MQTRILVLIGLFLSALFSACESGNTTENAGEDEQSEEGAAPQTAVAEPVFVTEATKHDSDDPAIWVHPEDPAKSLIVGTDKDEDGALYVFDLKGKTQKVVSNIKRPNNVDIEYGLMLGGKKVDIAVATERLTHSLRVFSLPDMEPIDGGGLPIFVGDTTADYRALMGIALYKNPKDENIYAIVSRKAGPREGYLGQYLLEDDGTGKVKATLARKFGKFSGVNEIEAIAVDDALGYVYCSDEGVGIRKYYADPEMGDDELAFFGKEGFAEDHEGISIFPTSDSTGYILVSDQQANAFRIFPREGTKGNPHEHPFLESVAVATNESDGSEVSAVAFNPTFQQGIFVAMSDDRTFQLYRIEDVLDLE